MSKDVFSSLYRWARANGQGENFTTDAFASLLREMIDRDSELASRFLGWLCFGSEKCCFFGRETKIDTQWTAQDGRPDIRITDRQAVAIVEVKTESDLRPDQLKDYRKILEKESAEEKRLVLLTIFKASVGDDEKLPNFHWWRWHEVEARLSANSSSEPVVQFLIEQFTTFLRGAGMAYDRVEWQYVDGVKSLVDLAHMLVEACNQAQVELSTSKPRSSWGFGDPYVGLNTDGKQFWVGVWWNRPRFVCFQFDDAPADTNKLNEETPNWQLAPNGKWERLLDLLSEDVHFFSRSKNHQVDVLAKFVKEAYDAARRCLAPGQTPPQLPQSAPRTP